MKLSLSGMGAMGQIVKRLADEQNIAILSTIHYDDGSTARDIDPASDVIVDFSHPANLDDLLAVAKAHQIKLVLATTGYSDEQLASIQAASDEIAILQSYNMSFSMSIVAKTLAHMMQLVDDSFDIEIVEMHHNKKVDAPSGTAKLLFDIVNQTGNFEPCTDYAPERGRKANQVGVHALRGGTVFGEHSIIFAGDDEMIELKHRALSKRIFASGALKGARLLMNRQSGHFTLTDLFN